MPCQGFETGRRERKRGGGSEGGRERVGEGGGRGVPSLQMGRSRVSQCDAELSGGGM